MAKLVDELASRGIVVKCNDIKTLECTSLAMLESEPTYCCYIDDSWCQCLKPLDFKSLFCYDHTIEPPELETKVGDLLMAGLVNGQLNPYVFQSENRVQSIADYLHSVSVKAPDILWSIICQLQNIRDSHQNTLLNTNDLSFDQRVRLRSSIMHINRAIVELKLIESEH